MLLEMETFGIYIKLSNFDYIGPFQYIIWYNIQDKVTIMPESWKVEVATLKQKETQNRIISTINNRTPFLQYDIIV